MKRVCLLIIAVSLLLSGCASLFDGTYISTTPHRPQNSQTVTDDVLASNYDELYAALVNMAQNGMQTGLIHIPQYKLDVVEKDMEEAVSTAMRRDPITAYAVETITWELGSSGQRAIAVNIEYIHDRSEIRKIREVADIESATEVILSEVLNASAGVVLYIQDYRKTDFVKMVEEYAFDNPQLVIETPQITENIYPKYGVSRVVELKFGFQTDREELKLMKSRVNGTFSSAKGYVRDDAQDRQKLFQLYSFLMERFDEYTIETSITPAFSLLWYGIGDSKAFATMYAALCRAEGLDCQVIRGTRDGEPWYWNLVKENDRYYHVDLPRSSALGMFQMLTDGQMQGYVWHYEAYPSCPDEQPEPTGTIPGSTGT